MWGSFLQPWPAGLLPIPIKQVMIGTAIFDVVIGFFMLVDFWLWPAALAASVHLAAVLAVSGIDAVTVRDIGLLAATIALFIDDYYSK